MPTLQEVLEYVDPVFAQAPEEVKKKIIDDLRGNPEKIDKVLSYVDPVYAKAPEEVKARILGDISDVSLPEKIARALAYGAGEFVEDLGSALKAGRELIEKLPFIPESEDKGLAETLIQLGENAKRYWIPDQYRSAYDFTGSSIIEEIPSLIGFGGVIGKGAKIGSALAGRFGAKGLAKAVAENVGGGLAYSGTQALSGDYESEDVAVQAALDTLVGAGGHAVGKAIKKLLSRGQSPESAVKALEEIETKLPEGEQRGAVKTLREEISELLDDTEILRKSEVELYRPFPMMGNKAQLLRKKGYAELFKEGVESSNRVIDAFMGTGLNSNIIERITDKKVPIIKNEFNPFRYRVYKELYERPEEVIRRVRQHVEFIDREYVSQLAKGKPSKQIKEQIESYLVQSIEKDPAVYIVAQHLTPASRPINSPKDVAVDIRKGETKIRGWQALKSGKVEERLRKTAEVLRKYPHEIRQGDAWELVKETRAGDFVIFDPDYIREGGRKVAGYGATTEDKELSSFLKKFDQIVLPKAREGVRFLITNTWDDGLAKALRERGFIVYRVQRRSAKSVKDELVAVNYRAGEITTVGAGGGKEVRPSHDLPDAGRGFGQTGQGLQGSGKIIRPHGDAPVSEGKVEGAGDTRLPDEIRDSGRRGRGGLEEPPTHLYSGGPSTQQIKEFFKVPEDPLKSAPPEIAEQGRLHRFASASNWKRWILPQYEWLKKDPRTVRVYRAAKAYTEGFEKDLNKWIGRRLEKIRGFLKRLPEEERLKIADYIEGKTTDISEEGKRIAKVIRRYLDQIYKYAKEQGLDIHYRENYFPHVFEGNIRVQVGDEFKSAKTWDEAIEIARQGMQEGKKVEIKAMLDPNIYELKITNPRFWRLVRKLEDGVELTEEEIKGLVKEAGIGRRPRYRFVSNLLQRKYDIEGYIKDPETALGLYTFNIIKKIHQDRFLKEFERAYEKINDPRLRQFLDEYRGQVLGYPTRGEQLVADVVNNFFKTSLGRWFLKTLQKSLGTEITPFDVRKGFGTAGFWINYFPDLGLRASSALVNATQTLTHTFPTLGFKQSALRGATRYIKGLVTNDPKIKQELFDAGILTELGFEGMKFKPEAGKDLPRTVGNIGMAPFSGVELMNRVATYGAAKTYGLKEGVKGMLRTLDLLGVPKHDPLWKLIEDPKTPLEKKAIEFAKEVVDKTQFRYEKFASPKILSGSIAKFIAPYKTFLINHLTFSARMLTKTKTHPREAILFFAIPILLAGKDGNPALSYTWDVLNVLYSQVADRDLEEDIRAKLGKLGDVLLGGLPRQAGADIRGAVKLDFPNPFDEGFYGRPIRLAKDIYDIAEGAKGWDEIKKELTPRFWKDWMDAYKILKTGLIKDSKGRIIGEGGKKDAVLRALGIRPPEYYDFIDKKELIYKLDKRSKIKYDPLINEFVDALISGDKEKVSESAEKIRDELLTLSEKIRSTSGGRQKAYLYLYLKLMGALEPSAIKRRIKSRLIPFSTDKKKLMLTN